MFHCLSSPSLMNFFVAYLQCIQKWLLQASRQMAFVCAVIACNSWDKAWCHTQLTHMHPACRILLPGSKALDLVCRILLCIHALLYSLHLITPHQHGSDKSGLQAAWQCLLSAIVGIPHVPVLHVMSVAWLAR